MHDPGHLCGPLIVSAVAENGITLKPIRALDNKQLAIIDSGGSWTLYEVLPVDDHSTLSGMTEESLQTLMAPLAADVAQEKLAASIQDFVRDGTPAQADDPPERVGVLVKFLVDHSIQVDIEAEAAADDDRTFDVRGRAIPPSLRQGFPTDFKAGDTALFDSATANQLVQDGKCELVNEPSRYVRALRNYGLIFRNEHDAIADVQADINRTTAENGTLIASAEQVRQQITYRGEEKRKLGEDLDNFERDRKTVAAYRDDLRSRREAQLEELARLYESNNRLRSQLSGL